MDKKILFITSVWHLIWIILDILEKKVRKLSSKQNSNYFDPSWKVTWQMETLIINEQAIWGKSKLESNF